MLAKWEYKLDGWKREKSDFYAQRTARKAKTSLPTQRSNKDWGWLVWGVAQGAVEEEEAKRGGVRPCLELSSASGRVSNRQKPTFPRPWRNDCSVRPRGSWPLQLCSHLSGTKVTAPLDFLSPGNQEGPVSGHLSRNYCGLWVSRGPPRTFSSAEESRIFLRMPQRWGSGNEGRALAEWVTVTH